MKNIIQLPGLIDIHVHFRDPGETHKENFYSGTCAALAGGVTTVFDMPNNSTPIFTADKLIEKLQIAKEKAVCDFGLYFGSIGDNIPEFEKAADLAVGLKLYLSTTTGKYVIGDQELIDYVFQKWPKEKVIVVHAEGDRVDLAIKMANKYQSKVHITHVSTAESLGKIIEAKKSNDKITCDTAPHYLLLTIDDIDILNGYGIVKPPLATKNDQEYLWRKLNYIDCIASDHAPHTIAEKESANPPAGIPGVETMLTLLMKEISVNEIIRLTNTNPRKIFGIRQDKETYLEVDKNERYKITKEKLFTRCGWSPFENREVTGRIKRVYIRGTKVFDEGKISVKPGFGQQVTLLNS